MSRSYNTYSNSATLGGLGRPGRSFFTPDRGMVLWCDFAGYRDDEIGDKIRPIVILTPSKMNSQTSLVAPISSSPRNVSDIRLPADRYPFLTPGRSHWAKPILITHVEYGRLGFFDGYPRPPLLDASDLQRVLDTVISLFDLKPAAAA